MLKRFALLIVAVIALAGSAESAVIYSQDTLAAGDRGAYQFVGQQMADDFIISANSVVDYITWQGSYYLADNLSGTESFTVQLFTGTASSPSNADFFEEVGDASMLASGTLVGKPLYTYTLDVTDFALTAGAQYWISIYSNDSPNNYAWANSSDGTANGVVYRENGGAWNMLPDAHLRENHLFALHGGITVPEPSTLLLLGSGLVGLGFVRRRFKA